MTDRAKTKRLESDIEPLPGEGKGWVRGDWKDAFAEAGLTDLDSFLLAQGEDLPKPGLGNRYRCSLLLKRNSDGEKRVYLKRFLNESIWSRMRHWSETRHFDTAGKRESRTANELLSAGFNVPPPLAWGNRKNERGKHDSFVVLGEADGKSLHHQLRSEYRAGPPLSWAAKRKLMDAIAMTAAAFHRGGWRHRDFYLCHLFVDETCPAPSITIIDLQRVFRTDDRTNRWRVKDLGQLLSSAPKEISGTLRLRFFKRYLGVESLSVEDKVLARRITLRAGRIRDREGYREG